MSGDVDPNATVDHFDDDEEEDPFHDADGNPVMGDVSAFEVGLYAHHCWRLGLDPVKTAELLKGF